MRHLLATTAAAAVALLGGPAIAGSVQTEAESKKVFACRARYNDGVGPTEYFEFNYQKRMVSRSFFPDSWMAKEMLFLDYGDRLLFSENDVSISQFEPENLKHLKHPRVINASEREAMALFYTRYTFNKKSKEIYVLRRGFSNWGSNNVAEDKAEYSQSEFRYKCIEFENQKTNLTN